MNSVTPLRLRYAVGSIARASAAETKLPGGAALSPRLIVTFMPLGSLPPIVTSRGSLVMSVLLCVNGLYIVVYPWWLIGTHLSGSCSGLLTGSFVSAGGW
eukprot:CAMPEP_0114156830 /NCGR_PEP_ID=MMETSP0043_2-20121206/26272_1 /TAXON_ID=464988 /ORGANISM="Hemiselmis andersenii, Strain CCMP644" /LENGTH=99 /DNA_ID=CAMNT_0001252307 /DNA_START=285 /DNA_END=584 /DNA_ORIENTATION=+